MFDDSIQEQHGAISRKQCLAYGVLDKAISARIRSHQWQMLFRGVYYVYSGPVPRLAWLWGAVLRGGPGCMLSHRTAAELHGLVDEQPSKIYITVPANRRVRGVRGLVIHTSVYAERQLNPVLSPPRTRIVETVLDLVDTSVTCGEAIGWLTKACSARLTTTERLQAGIDQRSRIRWRAETEQIVGDVAAGAMSALEICYLNAVERAHGLPEGERQHTAHRGGRRQYDDVYYRRYRTLVELDGRANHDGAARFRDMYRDNAATAEGEAVLRYGWWDVQPRPCLVARQVAGVLADRGWSGTPHPCTDPNCGIIANTFPPLTG